MTLELELDFEVDYDEFEWEKGLGSGNDVIDMENMPAIWSSKKYKEPFVASVDFRLRDYRSIATWAFSETK